MDPEHFEFFGNSRRPSIFRRNPSAYQTEHTALQNMLFKLYDHKLYACHRRKKMCNSWKKNLERGKQKADITN
jgi:hypothetical protein